MKHFYQSLPDLPQIDAENGIIRRVSLIRTGEAAGHRDAQGRQEMVDAKTLEQVHAYCVEMGSIKVKLDHGSGVLSTVGYVKNFSIENDKVLGDFHIYETADEKARILEVAAKNPTHMGMSLEFEGKDEPAGDKVYSRCTRVLTVALVSDPAANTSLFSAILPNETKTEIPIMEPEKDKDKPTTMLENAPSLEDRVNELSKKFEDMMTKFSKKFEDEEVETKEETEIKVEAPADDDDKKIELAAKRGAEAALKMFAANLGTTNLAKGGAAPEKVATKHFEEHVSEIAHKDFSGDTNKARAAILTNRAKYSDAWKSYEATRLVKHS